MCETENTGIYYRQVVTIGINYSMKVGRELKSSRSIHLM